VVRHAGLHPGSAPELYPYGGRQGTALPRRPEPGLDVWRVRRSAYYSQPDRRLNTQTITGLTALGRQTSNPQFQNPTLWIPSLSYSKILSKHSLKFGYQYMNIRTEILDTNPLYGQDTYSGGFSKPSGGPSDSTSYSLADFIFGLPNRSIRAVTRWSICGSSFTRCTRRTIIGLPRN
jgi:hypothetical protein